MAAKKSGALAHLNRLYDDSDAESDIDESPIHEVRNTDGATDHTNDAESMDHKQRGSDEHGEESQLTQETPAFRPVSPTTFHLSLQDLQSPDEIQIPPPPPGQPPAELVQRIADLYQKKRDHGIDMTASIEKRKHFRNPSIYEKLIVFCEIDEFGTNFPQNIYDPHRWGPEAYYDELAHKQKEEMDRKEKEKKEKTKVEFVTGTAKRNHGESETRKKTKWDVSSSSSGSTTVPSATSIATATASTKTTVTSKVGALIPGLNIRPSLVGSSLSTSVPVIPSTVGTIKPPVFTIKGTK